MSSIEYPAALETHWLAVAQAETRGGAPRDALHRLLPDIRRLADRFTVARPADAAAANSSGASSRGYRNLSKCAKLGFIGRGRVAGGESRTAILHRTTPRRNVNPPRARRDGWISATS